MKASMLNLPGSELGLGYGIRVGVGVSVTIRIMVAIRIRNTVMVKAYARDVSLCTCSGD